MAAYTADRVTRTLVLHKAGCRHIPTAALRACGCGRTGEHEDHQWWCEQHFTIEEVNALMHNRLWAILLCSICYAEELDSHHADQATVAAPRTQDASTPGRKIPIFNRTLERTYYRQGFFNVTVDFDQYVGEAGPVTVLLDNGRRIDAMIDRTLNRNGTARIFGGTALRDWFQENFHEGDIVAVDFSSPDCIRLSKP